MKFRTIIIEDEESIRHLLKLSAELRQHEVLDFADPTFCSMVRTGACGHEHPCSDIIISDQHMPKMTGLEFFGLLEARGCLVRNKALITASGQTNVQKRAAELHCAFLSKPFLLTDIDQWLSHAEGTVEEERQLVPWEVVCATH